MPAAELNEDLLEQGIVGGLALAKWYPELGKNAALWCATEITTRAQIDAAAEVLARTGQMSSMQGELVSAD